MPKQYAREFRRAVCERLVAGEKVSALSKEVGVSEGTLYLWKRQALIDAGRAEGVKSFEADELAQAHKTIAAASQPQGWLGVRHFATFWRRTAVLRTEWRVSCGTCDSSCTA